MTLLLFVLAFTSRTFAQDKPLLQHSIVGGSSCATKPCYGETIRDIQVQKLLLALARGPRTASYVEPALRSATASLDDLLYLQLVRREGNRYFLNFPLFTAADVTRIRQVSEEYADSLAAAILAHRSEIESKLKAYDVQGVDRKALAYYLLGCVSLDLDGLNITREKGYRRASEKHPDGNYIPAAEETNALSLQRIYWGSHSSFYNGATWTSFGDHYSPRYTLPDLFWELSAPPSEYPAEIRPQLKSFMRASLTLSATSMTRMMHVLRDGNRTLPELAQSAELSEDEARPLVEILVALEFIRKQNESYQVIVPVLTTKDEAMAKQIVAIGDKAIEEWLAANYSKMKTDLKGLSFTRSGVPFEDGFTMIWHYLFGITNRKLVQSGLFADPYGPNRKYPGSIPAVSEVRLP